jgi:hypothetical protein
MTRLVLTIDDGSEPIQGSVTDGDNALPFSGWLGLAAALEQLLKRHETTPISRSAR